MGQNIIQKIREAHLVYSQPGFPDVMAIDLHLLHEVTSPQAFAQLKHRELKVHAPRRCLATVDHVVPTDPAERNPGKGVAAEMLSTLRDNCRACGIKLLDIEGGRQGIVHVVAPEQGLTQPGMTIVCGDSHTATHGAFGALAFGIGTSEVANVLASGCLLRNRPKTMRVEFHGNLPEGVSAKDMILKLIQTIGIGGATNHIIEYCGSAVEALSMEQRMTLCNMSIECGARSGLISPDHVTFEYLKNRPAAPRGEKWLEALAHWRSFCSDPDASWDRSVSIDVSALAPMVSWGTNPAQCVEIDRAIPAFDEYDLEEAEASATALEYTKLDSGISLEGLPVDYVFIGSCTNGRIEDFRQAARIFQDRKVAPKVQVFLVPGSEKVWQQAEKEGLDDLFSKAGVQMRAPGCSMCLAMNGDVVPAGKRCASTSNRNFAGRQGDGAITHLMSPAMAAAAAVTGKITDVRKL